MNDARSYQQDLCEVEERFHSARVSGLLFVTDHFSVKVATKSISFQSDQFVVLLNVRTCLGFDNGRLKPLDIKLDLTLGRKWTYKLSFTSVYFNVFI